MSAHPPAVGTVPDASELPAAPCPFEDEVLLLADGELSFTRRIVVEAHLGICDSCAAVEDVLAVVQDVLVAEPIEPLGAAERALAALPEQGPRLRPFILAAAAAALVFVAIRSRSEDEAPPAPPLVASESKDHHAPENQVESPGDARDESGVDSRRATVVPPISDDPAARPALPTIPPPQPPVGPTLRLRLADLDALGPADLSPTDPANNVRDRVAREIAQDVRRRGTRGSRALAEVLASSDERMVRVALVVAGNLESPAVTAAVARLTSHPRLGDLAAVQLSRRRDESAVPALIDELDSTRSIASRDALAAIGGRAAARALVRSFWTAPPAHREGLLAAAVRADPVVGGMACLEAAATPREEHAKKSAVPRPELAGLAFDEVARAVVASRPERLLPYLRRAATGRDALRARVALRALGWAHDEDSVADLRRLARSPRTASAAVAALLDIGTRDALGGAFDAALLTGREGVGAVAFQGRFAAESFVLQRLQSGDVREKGLALALLARCGGPGAALALSRADVPRSLLDELVRTLGAIGGDEAAIALGARATVPGLELAVVAALGQTGSAHAVPHLRRISAASPRRREAVVAALAQIESSESVVVLISLLPDSRAGRAAIEAVAALPVGLVVPGLLNQCGESVPAPVRRALARIAGRDLGSSPGRWRAWWAARA